MIKYELNIVFLTLCNEMLVWTMLTLFFSISSCLEHNTTSLDIDVLPNEILPHLSTTELFDKVFSTNKRWYFAAIEALSYRTKELSIKQIKFILDRIQQIKNLPRSRLELLSLRYRQEVGGRSAWLSSINTGRLPICLNMTRSFGLYLVSTLKEHMDVMARITMRHLHQNMTFSHYLKLGRVSKRFFLLIRNHDLIFLMYQLNNVGQPRITNSYVVQCPGVSGLSSINIDKAYLRLWTKTEKPHNYHRSNRTILTIVDIHSVREEQVRNEIEQQLWRLNSTPTPIPTSTGPDLLQQAHAAPHEGECCSQ